MCTNQHMDQILLQTVAQFMVHEPDPYDHVSHGPPMDFHIYLGVRLVRGSGL